MQLTLSNREADNLSLLHDCLPDLRREVARTGQHEHQHCQERVDGTGYSRHVIEREGYTT